MGFVTRNSFQRGWAPDADAVNAPTDSLLRADNLVLDELDILSNRRGRTRINTVPLSADVHSLYVVKLSGTKYRMAGAGNDVYANESLIVPSFAGSGDIQFGAYQGQIFSARSTTKRKFDGAIVRNWGILMTGASPAAGAITAGSLPAAAIIIAGDAGESPALVWEEDNGTGPSYGEDPSGVPNEAAIMFMEIASILLGRLAGAQVRKTLAALTDYGTNYTDNDLISIDVFFEDPARVQIVEVLFYSGSGSVISRDPGFIFSWYSSGIVVGGPRASSTDPSRSNNHDAWNPNDPPDSWRTLSATRGSAPPQPSAVFADWSKIRQVRVRIVDTQVQVSRSQYVPPEVRIHELRIGGTGTTSTVETNYRYVYVRQSDCYAALSPYSDESPSFVPNQQGSEVTIPADPNRDPQVNQIWLYRFIEEAGNWYRVAVAYGNPADPTDLTVPIGTGAIVIQDTLTNSEVLEINIPIELNAVPPDDIVGIEGPYYDRLFAITEESIYPSRRLNPDSYSPEQVIRISCADDRLLWVRKSTGGMFVGTTRDIYRLDGTGAELPDGTVEFTLRPVNIDYPPVSEAVAQEGNNLVYLSGVGWRVLEGAGSRGIEGRTSLLWRGQDRHGVLAVNKSGRHRAAIAYGDMFAITPEGPSSSSSPVIYRHQFENAAWWRHPYTSAYRSIFRDPDGDIIAGDEGGFIYTLGPGGAGATTSDDGAPIAIEILTPRDSFGTGYAPKDAANLSVVADSNGGTATAEVFLDDSAVSAFSATFSPPKIEFTPFDLSGLATVWQQLRLRITGSFTRFRFSGWGCTFNALPMGVKVWDSGPMDLGSHELVRLRGIRIKARLEADVTANVYFDGTAFAPVTLSSSAVGSVTMIEAALGRGQFGKTPRVILTSPQVFYPYWVELLVHPTGSRDKQDKPLLRFPTGLGGEAAA